MAIPLQVLKRIARRHRLQAILLFGSRARGDARPGSDTDLCISAPHLRGDGLGLLRELADAMQQDLDICFFERIGPSLALTAVMEGRPLYGTPDAIDRLRLRAIMQWQDSRPYLESARAALDRAAG